MLGRILAFISSLLLCSVKFGVAFPVTIRAHDFNFLESMLFGMAAGLLGITVFLNAGEFLNHHIDRLILKYRHKNVVQKKKKIFTKSNRRFVKIKSRFGLPGIAFLTPSIISIPIGVFLAVRFFHNKKKIFVYMMIAHLFWTLIFSLINEGVRFLI